MLLHTPARAQSLESFLADPAFTPASIGICITDVATGETLVSHNDRQAIIPASTVKVITSATALRLLGADYRTSTTVGYTGQIDSAGTLHGTLVIRGGGDPSLGSAYGSRPAEEFVDRVIDALQTHRIRAIEGMADVLGRGIANLCYMCNPETVVLGGGIMEQREYLYPRIRERMDGYLLPFIAARTRLAMAQLGNRAGMLGAFYHFRGCQTEQRQKDG